MVIDLGNPRWDRFIVTRDGWKLDSDCRDAFIRSPGMMPLPFPKKTSNGLELFRKFVNVSDQELPLIVGWMIGALCPFRPYPLLAIHGEQGSSKSTTSRVCRRLVDPSKADLRSSPRNEQDLILSCFNSWVIALENLSFIPGWLSDALCRIATGGGFATRQLYTNNEESIIEVQRPILINGIEELASRSDLIDRSIFLTLPRISEQQRKPEADFWLDFNQAKGAIFGWLLDCVAAAIRNLSIVELESLPRMADFAKWVCAAETSIGWDGKKFLATYQGNRRQANETAVEASEIGKALGKYLSIRQSFEGNATDLLSELNEAASDEQRKQRQAKNSGWPRSARGLSGKLRRIAPNLRQMGFDIELNLPGRLIRLGMQPTVSTVSTDADDQECDESRHGSDCPNGRTHNQSKRIICRCGQRMTQSDAVINGWSNWDCICGNVTPIQVSELNVSRSTQSDAQNRRPTGSLGPF